MHQNLEKDQTENKVNNSRLIAFEKYRQGSCSISRNMDIIITTVRYTSVEAHSYWRHIRGIGKVMIVTIIKEFVECTTPKQDMKIFCNKLNEIIQY